RAAAHARRRADPTTTASTATASCSSRRSRVATCTSSEFAAQRSGTGKLSAGGARANRVRDMQPPSLRRPVGASVLAGVLGAGLVDAALTASHGGATGVLVLAVGLYGAAGILAAFAAELVVDTIVAARPAGWGPLRDEPERDRAVAAGIL